MTTSLFHSHTGSVFTIEFVTAEYHDKKKSYCIVTIHDT